MNRLNSFFAVCCSCCVLLGASLPAWASLRLEGTHSGFFYPAEAPLRYQALKHAWLETHVGTLPSVHELAHLAWVAHEELEGGESTWLPIPHWRMVDGPNAWVITPRVQVVNDDADRAEIHWRVRYQYRVLLAHWYPQAPSALLDVARLQANQAWLTVGSGVLQQEALAPKEEALRWLPSLQILEVLQAHPDRWASRIEVKAQLESLEGQPVGTPLLLTLALTPDLFTLPIYLY